MDYEFSRPLRIDHIDRHGVKQTITPDEYECDALCKRFDLDSIESLQADISVSVSKILYHVTGKLTGFVNQVSVVSGNPVPTSIKQDIDAYYIDNSRIACFEQAKAKKESDDEYEIKDEKEDPESIQNGEIDLGEVAAQFLGLALDDYPRAENEGSGDYIEAKPEDAKPNPFAVLKDLNVKK